MKIVETKLYSLTVPRRYGTVIAHEGGTAEAIKKDSAFVFIEATTDNGLTGWGEVSDADWRELFGSFEDVQDFVNQKLLGRSPYQVQDLHQQLRELDYETEFGRCLSCGLDMILYDLQGKCAGVPVFDLLGGAIRHKVQISWVAYIREELDLIRAEIEEQVAAGFTAFKLKVGVDIDLDEERVAVAREVAGPQASIKVDANEGWSVAEAPGNIGRLNRFDIAGVESPVPRANPVDIAAVRKQVDVPILEHVHDVPYGLELIQHKAVDVFNVATTGAGGIWPARQVAALAAASGTGVLLGSTVEMGLGTLAQLHLAATVPNLTLPSDLVGPGLYELDGLAESITYDQGWLHVPGGVGLGGRVDLP